MARPSRSGDCQVFRIWRERAKSGLTSREARERLAQMESMLRVQLLDKHQAEVSSKEGETVANLVRALEQVPSACITFGSLAVLKYHVNGEPVFHARHLSAMEVQALGRFPDLHKHPEKFFESLADAVALPEIEPRE